MLHWLTRIICLLTLIAVEAICSRGPQGQLTFATALANFPYFVFLSGPFWLLLLATRWSIQRWEVGAGLLIVSGIAAFLSLYSGMHDMTLHAQQPVGQQAQPMLFFLATVVNWFFSLTALAVVFARA